MGQEAFYSLPPHVGWFVLGGFLIIAGGVFIYEVATGADDKDKDKSQKEDNTSSKETKSQDEPLSTKAPNQVEPGVRELEGQYVNDQGRVEKWKAYYDEYGRLIARTDYNAENKAAGIADTHHHLYEWGRGKNPHEYGSHIPGEYKP